MSLEKLIEYFQSHQPKGPTPAEMRAWFEDLVKASPAPPEARLEPSTCSVPASWLTPPGARTNQVILYLHGGGYILGSPATHRELTFRLAQAAGTRALLVDYRLAPENQHPACVEDAVAAYRWLLSQDVAPRSIAIAGDSAGGGLTLSTLIALRDAGVPLPGCAVLFSPWADFTGSGESAKTNAGKDPLIPPEMLATLTPVILGGKDPRESSPLFAKHQGLPPMLVQVGASEVLLDDARRLCESVKAQGGEAVFDLWESMVHGFHAFPTFVPEAVKAVEQAGAFIQTKLG